MKVAELFSLDLIIFWLSVFPRVAILPRFELYQIADVRFLLSDDTFCY